MVLSLTHIPFDLLHLHNVSTHYFSTASAIICGQLSSSTCLYMIYFRWCTRLCAVFYTTNTTNLYILCDLLKYYSILTAKLADILHFLKHLVSSFHLCPTLIFFDYLITLVTFLNLFSPNLLVHRILLHRNVFNTLLAYISFMWITSLVGIFAGQIVKSAHICFRLSQKFLLLFNLRSFSRQLVLRNSNVAGNLLELPTPYQVHSFSLIIQLLPLPYLRRNLVRL